MEMPTRKNQDLNMFDRGFYNTVINNINDISNTNNCNYGCSVYMRLHCYAITFLGVKNAVVEGKYEINAIPLKMRSYNYNSTEATMPLYRYAITFFFV